MNRTRKETDVPGKVSGEAPQVVATESYVTGDSGYNFDSDSDDDVPVVKVLSVSEKSGSGSGRTYKCSIAPTVPSVPLYITMCSSIG